MFLEEKNQPLQINNKWKKNSNLSFPRILAIFFFQKFHFVLGKRSNFFSHYYEINFTKNKRSSKNKYSTVTIDCTTGIFFFRFLTAHNLNMEKLVLNYKYVTRHLKVMYHSLKILKKRRKKNFLFFFFAVTQLI